MSRRVNRLKIIWLFVGGLAAGLLVGVILRFMQPKPGLPVNTPAIVSEKIYFKSDKGLEGLTAGEESYPDIKSMIEANYLRYLKKAYVLMGSYPGCELIKISANVERNDIDWENDFYCDPGEIYYRRHRGEESIGKIGIDVSEFQGNIDWEKVKAAGIEVAIIRIGYRGYGKSGTIKLDSKAYSYLRGAQEVGIATGVYFFSSAINREEGIEEAQFVLDSISGYNITEPVIIDTERVFEDESARANNISVEERTDAVKGFCETIEAAGYTPMIYASRDQFVRYLNVDIIGNWEFWYCSYDNTSFPYHTEGYQYSRKGYVDGISTEVDMDVWMR